MRKLFAVLALACVVPSCLAATAVAKPTPTQLSIRAYPGGVFGFVASADLKTCSSDRKILVYEQTGSRREPKSDPRVASDLAEVSGSRYRWTVKTDRVGRLYARVVGTKRCAATQSATVETSTPTLEAAPAATGYPPCSPYVSEGTSEICDLGKLDMKLANSGGFSDSSGQEPGTGSGAPFPWGRTYYGAPSHMRIYWHPEGSERSVVIVSFWGSSAEGDGTAHLGGHIANSGSNSFTVTDAFAQNESGYPNGDHFYTPDLPGQAPGEVGGPLYFNFKNGSGGGSGEVLVNGYLYLKR